VESTARKLKKHWQWAALIVVTLAVRLYLLHVYDIELSEDGFDSVKTLSTFQAHGFAGLSIEEITRIVLHPLYMLWLYVFRLVVPASIDFYIAARLLSTLVAVVAVVLLFEFVRQHFDDAAAWMAALLFAFAPSFLWESVAILSSTLFLVLYLAVVMALARSHYRRAALFAFLAAITRAEGIALIALVGIALLLQSVRVRKWQRGDWITLFAFAVLVPITILGSSWLATGNPLAFLGAQSISTIWLRFLAPGDFFSRAPFFITRYSALFPLPVVLLGLAGAVAALLWHRGRARFLLIGLSALYLLFFEALVWFDYTTLEVRFLMYPGLPLLVFAGVALADGTKAIRSILNRWQGVAAPDSFHSKATVATKDSGAKPLMGDTPTVGRRLGAALGGALWSPHRPPWQGNSSENRRVSGRKLDVVQAAVTAGLVALMAVLLAMSYTQGDLGIRFLYNMMASQREMADALAHLIPPNQPTNLMVYTGNAGALDLFGRQRGLELDFTDFRFSPDDAPEQYLIDRRIQFVVYPVGNAFAKAKYPYLAQFETQTHGAVTFRPLLQFATSTDNQLYSIWAVSY
jgi:hypothetical protein